MNINYVQLFVRIAVATAFLSAVADRFGYWGKPGSPNVSWGNWEQFLIYSNKLNFFVSPEVGELLAIIATVLEIIFALFLVIGYKTKGTSFASGILLAIFAVSMTLALGIKSTFTYSVWIGSGACFLLCTLNDYRYSLDMYLKKLK
ncbi:DoxX family protein [Algoriphagus boritolerans]|uniref:DoxX protein n=1 Tax=Algoriphagus boritolerans DSM 17298 = JCM 18970 TaxID=1120964 RepID=A0A1H6AQS4_9BACT|nr:DoxX family protein [Algoriphagus boritolerans]SEG50742.1 DoxX protein [Algoriphagus boritolerans DSM 17298 = JCM 18970]